MKKLILILSILNIAVFANEWYYNENMKSINFEIKQENRKGYGERLFISYDGKEFHIGVLLAGDFSDLGIGDIFLAGIGNKDEQLKNKVLITKRKENFIYTFFYGTWQGDSKKLADLIDNNEEMKAVVFVSDYMAIFHINNNKFSELRSKVEGNNFIIYAVVILAILGAFSVVIFKKKKTV